MPAKKFFLRNFEFNVFDSVYPPAEDSELLASAIRISKGARVLDLGCGSGIQGINAILQGAGFVCFADKNPRALENAKSNLSKLGSNAKTGFVETNLFSQINGKFDFILFNPPYVPSNGKKYLDLDGGKKGREVLDKFLFTFPKFLSEKGKVFFLQSSLNGIEQTEKILKQQGFSRKIVARKKLFFEELVVFCAWRE
ncbi:MAG: methyltransferase [Candidatus Diapherotrites archaeon]|nr:methyltransferase [Candidatus Diapherotrites archaeon]